MAESDVFELYDVRVTVSRIEGRSVCGLAVGDYFEVTQSSRIYIPADRHFCLFALGAVLPLLAGVMRAHDPNDWLLRDTLIACPDPDERLIMEITRIGRRTLITDDLT